MWTRKFEWTHIGIPGFKVYHGYTHSNSVIWGVHFQPSALSFIQAGSASKFSLTLTTTWPPETSPLCEVPPWPFHKKKTFGFALCDITKTAQNNHDNQGSTIKPRIFRIIPTWAHITDQKKSPSNSGPIQVTEKLFGFIEGFWWNESRPLMGLHHYMGTRLQAFFQLATAQPKTHQQEKRKLLRSTHLHGIQTIICISRWYIHAKSYECKLCTNSIP